MRPILIALLLLIITATCRAEFDAAGVASAKPKATGAAFDSGAAASRRQPLGQIADGVTFVLIIGAKDGIAIPIAGRPMPVAIAPALLARIRAMRPVVPGTQAPQPIMNNPSNIPRPRR